MRIGLIHEYEDAGVDASDEDNLPVIIGVPSRGEGKTKSGLREAFREKNRGG